jgi:hypothetical protein
MVGSRLISIYFKVARKMDILLNVEVLAKEYLQKTGLVVVSL